MNITTEEFNRRKAEYENLCNEVNAAYLILEKENEASRNRTGDDSKPLKKSTTQKSCLKDQTFKLGF